MKIALSVLVLGLITVPLTAAAQTMDHTIIAPQDLKWGKAPPSVPPGAEAVTLYGDPGKEGMFAFRLKLPKGYRIPAHTHPKPEIVTVISGTFRLGMGESSDPSKAQALPAGSFFVMAPGMVHTAFADEDAVVQLNSTGPWGITYVNPKDDPRQKTQ